MRESSMFKLIQWWMTPKLPREHIFIPAEKRPKQIDQIVKIYLLRWLVHPIKRRIAKYYLAFLKSFFGITVIAITGSAGKTTAKEMIASILKQKGETQWTYANIDPVYNIPTTILKCRPSTKYLVLEMGVEFPGEMDYYLWLAKVDIAVITNIYPTHTEFFGNTDGVAAEKVKLIKSLTRDGTAILNSENVYTNKFASLTKAQVVWYGKKGDVIAKNVLITKDMNTKYTLVDKLNKIDVQIPIIGREFIDNSLAAAAVGYVCQVDDYLIKKGLETYHRPVHRMNIIMHSSRAVIIDDSYNNNPEAAKTVIETMITIAGRKRKIVVFGDMLELGRLEKSAHKKIGKYIAERKIECLIGVGPLSKLAVEQAKKVNKKANYFWVEKEGKVDSILEPFLNKETIILVKGSRSIGLDKLVLRLSRDVS